MRRMIQTLVTDITSFLEQNDDLILTIAAPDHCKAILNKIVFDLDTTSPADFFLMLKPSFANPTSWIDTVISELRTTIDSTNAVAEDGDELIPTVPILSDGPPAYRLQRLMEYGRSLVDPERNQKMVWSFLPESIADEAAYRKLLAAALTPSMPLVGWMHGTRLIVRIPEGSKPFPPDCPRVRHVDFVPPADVHERELLLDLKDPAMPEQDRMQSLIQLAYIDAAHGRTRIANERFSTALHFFQWLKVPALEAVIMNGLGDVARRDGNPAAARQWFQAALEPAGRSGVPVLVGTVVQNLGVQAYTEKNYGEAAECYADLAAVKRVSLDEVGLVEALEWQGRSLAAEARWKEAIPCWEEAAAVSEEFDMRPSLQTILPELKKAYEATDQKRKLAGFAQVWPVELGVSS